MNEEEFHLNSQHDHFMKLDIYDQNQALYTNEKKTW